LWREARCWAETFAVGRRPKNPIVGFFCSAIFLEEQALKRASCEVEVMRRKNVGEASAALLAGEGGGGARAASGRAG